MNKNLDIQVSIEEMSELLDKQFDSMEAIKTTARTIFGSASLVTSILGAFKLTTIIIVEDYAKYFNIGIVISMVLYVILIVCCIFILLPINMKLPIEANWKVLRDAFVGKEERDILKMQLSAYLNAISHNDKLINSKKKLATIASVILPLIVITLLIVSVLPRS
jgi:hypothetical protein